MESAALSTSSTTADERHFINLCAFKASFWHQYPQDWNRWALYLVKAALVEEHDKALTDLYGQAVAQLFLFSGPEMYASSKLAEAPEPLTMKGTTTTAASNWEFWKKRLSQLKASELTSNETKELCSRGLENMAKTDAEH